MPSIPHKYMPFSLILNSRFKYGIYVFRELITCANTAKMVTSDTNSSKYQKLENGGDEGNRTPDSLRAKQMLYP